MSARHRELKNAVRIMVLSMVGAGAFCFSVSAEEELGRGKSTVETIQLPSLDAEDLDAAMIGGSLDAPAAGESDEVPFVLKETDPDLEPRRDTREDFGRFNVPAEFNLRPEPLAVGGRTYNYDYVFTQQR